MAETPHEDRVLDWRPGHDPRNLNFPIRTLLRAAPPARRNKTWKPGPILDQGADGACVGFGWTAEAGCRPVPVKLAKPYDFAMYTYNLAKQLDEWPGDDYEGSSVLAGAKAMVRQKLLLEYRWASGVSDVVDTVLSKGPVVLGTPWRQEMFNPDPATNIIHARGDVAGGHCYLAVGYRVDPGGGEGYVQIQNSWGESWGNHGLALVSVSDLAGLLRDDGEACVPVRRSYGGNPRL